MRSDLVFGASSQVSNRYRLCRLATKATRKLHRPNSRLQDTINRVLIHFQEANPEAEAAGEGSMANPLHSRGYLRADLASEFAAEFPRVSPPGSLRSMRLDGHANEVEMR